MSDIPPYRPDPLATGFEPPAGSPADRTHDEHVAFPDDAGPGGAPTQLPPTAWRQPERPPQPPPSQPPPIQPTSAPPRRPSWQVQQPTRLPGFGPRRRSGLGRIIALVTAGPLFGLFLVLMVIFMLAGGRSDERATPAAPRPTVAVTSLPVAATSLPPLPLDVTSLRVEIQGSGRSVDVSLTQNGRSTRLDDVALPYAVSVSVARTSSSRYLTVSARNYRGSGSMRCTIWAGDQVIAMTVGTTRVECSASTSALPISGGGSR